MPKINQGYQGGQSGSDDITNFLNRGNAADFNKFYQEVAAKNQGNNDDEEETKQLKGFDKGVYYAFKTADAIANLGGWNENFSNTDLATDPVGKIGNFGLSLLPGMASAFVSGPANIYEGLTRHDVQSADQYGGEMMNAKELTPKQAAGALVNGGIDTIGTMIGGSGRLISSGLNLAGRFSPKIKKVADTILPTEGKGVFRDSELEHAEKFGGDLAKADRIGKIKQAAWDIGEEGAEEFVQSGAEDARDGRDFDLGKALEQGAWGLAGGAAFTGGAALMNAAANIGKGKNKPTGSSPSSRGQTDTRQDPNDQNLKYGNRFDNTYIPAYGEAADKKVMDNTVDPGASAATVVPGSQYQHLNDVAYGAKDWRAMWFAQGDDGHNLWASKLGTTVDNINQIVERTLTDDDALVNEVNGLLKQLPGGKARIGVGVGRNPATDPTSSIAMWFTGLEKGSGMKIAPLAAQLAGADVDGDTKSLMFKDDKNLVLPTEAFMNPNGSHNFNMEYIPYLDSDEARSELHNAFDQVIMSKLGTNVASFVDFKIDEFIDALSKCNSGDKSVMREAQTQASHLNAELGQIIGQDTVNDAMSEFFSEINRVAGKESVIKANIKEADGILKEYEDLNDVIIQQIASDFNDKDIKKFFTSSGYAGDIDNAAKLSAALGYVISIARNKKSLAFREDQAYKYHSKNFETMLSAYNTLGYNLTDNSDFNKLIANMLRLTDAGEDISHQINSIMKDAIVYEFFRDMGFIDPSYRIGGNNFLGIDFMLDKFETIADKYIDIANKAKKESGNDGRQIKILGRFDRRKISFKSRSEGGDRQDAMDVMFDILKDCLETEIFYMPDATTERTIEAAAMEDQEKDQPSLKNIGISKEALDFTTEFYSRYGSKEQRIHNKIMKVLEEAPRVRIEDASKIENFVEVEYIIDSVLRFLDGDILLDLKLAHVSDVLNRTDSQDIIDGDQYQRANVLVSISNAVKFNELVKMADLVEQGKMSKGDLIAAAENMRDMSTLTEIIVTEFKKNGKSGFLDMLKDPNVSYEEKQARLDSIAEGSMLKKESLLVSSLRTDRTDITLDEFSDRIQKASNSMSIAKKNSLTNWQDELKALKHEYESLASDNARNIFYRDFESYIIQLDSKCNKSAVADMMIDSTKIALPLGEKGTAIASGGLVNQQIVNRFKGGQYSHINDIFSLQNGIMHIDDFFTNRKALIAVLFNGKTITVFGDNNDFEVLDCKKLVSKVVGYEVDIKGDGKPSPDQFMEMLEKAPNLLGILAEETTVAIPNEDQQVTKANATPIVHGFKRHRANKSHPDNPNAAELEMTKIRWKLWCDPGFYPALAAAAQLEPGMSDSEKRQKILEAEDRVLRAICNKAEVMRSGKIKGKDDLDKLVSVQSTNYAVQSARNAMETLSQMTDARCMNEDLKNVDLVREIIDPATGLILTAQDDISNIFAEIGMGSVFGIDAFDYKSLDEEGKKKYDDFKEMFLQDFGIIDEKVTRMFGGEEVINSLSYRLASIVGEENYKEICATRITEDIIEGLNRYVEDIIVTESMERDIKATIRGLVDKSFSHAKASIKLNYMFFSEEDINDRSEYESKVVSYIEETYGPSEVEKARKKIDKLYNDLNDPKTEPQARVELEKIRKDMLFDSIAKSMSAIGSLGADGFNFDVYQDVAEISDWYVNTIDEIANDEEFTLAYYPEYEKYTELPPINMAYAENSYMALHSKMNAMHGAIVSGVGLNGAIQNHLAPLACVDHSVECNSTGYETTIGDIKVGVFHWQGVSADIVKPDGTTERRTLNSAFDFSAYPDDTVVRIYDDELDPCLLPFCSKCAKKSGRPGMQDVINGLEELTSILANSQEESFLRLKKTLDAIKKISSLFTGDVAVPPAVLNKVNGDVDAYIEELQKNMKEYRRAMYRHAMSGFKDAGVSVNEVGIKALVKDQITCFMFEFSNDDGTIGRRIVSMNDMMKDGKMVLPEGLNPDAILSAKPFLTPIEMMNKKIAHDLVYRGKNDPKVTKDNFKQEASKAIMHWDNYGAGEMDVLGYLLSTPSKKLAHSSQLIPADSPTELQKWFALTNNRGPFGSPRETVDLDPVTDKGAIKAAARDTRDLVNGLGVDDIVAAVDIDGANKNKQLSSENLYELRSKHAAKKNPEDNKRFSGKNNGYLYYTDDTNKLNDFLKNNDTAWSYDFILIPKNMYDSLGNNKPRITGKVSVGSIQFVKIDCVRSKNAGYVGGLMPQFSTRNINPFTEIYMIIEDDLAGLVQGPDSYMFTHPEAAASRGFMLDDSFNTELQYMRKDKSYNILTKKELKTLFRNFDKEKAGIKYPKDIKGIDQGMMESALMSLLKEASGPNSGNISNDGHPINDVSIYSCIGVAHQRLTIGEGEQLDIYEPIFINGKAPKQLDKIDGLEKDGYSIKINQSTLVKFEDGEAWKFLLDHEAYKGECVFLRPEQIGNMPMPALGSNSGQYNNVMWADSKSRDGRLAGKELFKLKENCYFGSRVMQCSLRGTFREENGVVTIDHHNDLSKYGREHIDEMFNSQGNSELWDAIIYGTETLFEDTYANKPLNSAIQKIARDAIYKQNGVVLKDFFETFHVTNDGKSLSPKPVYHPEYSAILKNLTKSETMALFNKMNGKLIYNPRSFPQGSKDSVFHPGTLLRDDGRILCTYTDGVARYLPGYIGKVITSHNFTNVGKGTGEASYGQQHIIKNALRFGVRDQDFDDFMTAIKVEAGAKIAASYEDSYVKKDIEKGYNYNPISTYGYDIDIMQGIYGDTYQRRQLKESFDDVIRSYGRVGIKITDENEELDVYNNSEIRNQHKKLKNILGWRNMNTLEFLAIIKSKRGITLNNGDGNANITLDQLKDTVTAIGTSVANGDFFLGGGRFDGDRVSVAMLPKEVMHAAWNESTVLNGSKHNGLYKTYDEFFKAAQEDMKHSYKAIQAILPGSSTKENISMRKKKQSLMIMMAALEMNNDIPISNDMLLGSYGLSDLRRAAKDLYEAYMYDDDVADFEEIVKQSTESYEHALTLRDASLSRNRKFKADAFANDGYSLTVKNSDAVIPVKVLKGMERAIMGMSVANPFVLAANVIETTGHTLIMKAAMKAPISPYKVDGSLFTKGQKAGVISDVVNNKQFMKVFTVLRAAQVVGMDEEILVGFKELNTSEEIEAFIDDLYKGRTKYDKVFDTILEWSSGSKCFEKTQAEFFIEFMENYCIADDVREQTHEIAEGRTMFENGLMYDPTRWLIESMSRDSGSRVQVLRAMNSANQVAMARENVFSLLMSDFLSKHPVVSLMNTGFMTPFYRYATNKTGRVLNWVMPISSMNYLLVNKLKNNPNLAHLELERTQIHVDLKAAILADAMHMSIPVLAMLIGLGLKDALQPPEDEDKVFDFREWTFFGFRVGAEWWIEDPLGPALPMACSLQSAVNGDPRMDILFEGLSTVLMNNPLMKISEVVDAITEPDAFIEGWQDEADRYKWAQGGEPSPFEQATAVAEQAGLMFIGKLITPSILKEWNKWATNGEKSYKRIYAQGVTGVNANNGETADTVRTSYNDAMIRQITRNNPVLGFLMDFVNPSNTSYMSMTNPLSGKQGMPNVVYEEPVQRWFKKEFSIRYQDESGEYHYKSEDEQMQVAADIIATLQQYDDMEELRKKGFYIDNETRMFVSDIIWQIVAEKNATFYSLYYSDEADAYVLGDGDWTTGQQERQRMYNEHEADIKYWKDTIYYGRLWSSELRRPMQKYFRENTEYWQDANGEFYASGFPKATSLFPVVVAEGSIDDPGNTMGWAGDWDTPSNLNGLTTGERALVPVQNEDWTEVVDFDDFEETNKDLAKLVEDAKNGKNTSYYDEVANGGGYPYTRRSGSSGGGSSRPSIYSRPADFNVSSPRQSSSGTLRDTTFDYLRPGFETKGSRESYRRSDF